MMMHQAVRFVFEALRIPSAPNDRDWPRLLAFADRTQLTLFLAGVHGCPPWVCAEIAARAKKNAERLRRLQAAYCEIAASFTSARIDFVLLKGFTHAAFGVDPSLRVQYDLDILCQPDDLHRAIFTLEKLGYAPHTWRSLSDQHISPMVKPGKWNWSGDYFDPDIPISVDLHTAAWNNDTDRIRLAGAELFWRRRCRDYHAFTLADRIAFASLHALRHILRNDARPSHVFELAYLLDQRAADYEFWNQWRALHDPQLRRLEAITFRFAQEWFRCRLPDAVMREIDALNPRIHAWFKEFAWSPVSNLLAPNKNVLWLHLALIGSLRDRMAVLRQRLFPMHWPEGVAERGTGSRVRYHALAIAPALASGIRWWRRSTAF